MKACVGSSLILSLFMSHVASASGCAYDLNSLSSVFDVSGFSTRWTEVGASDGQPLLLTISQGDGSLFLQFVKSGQGTWVAGEASICGGGGSATATISADQVTVNNLPWAVKLVMGDGASFNLRVTPDGRQLSISGGGWTGRFFAE